MAVAIKVATQPEIQKGPLSTPVVPQLQEALAELEGICRQRGLTRRQVCKHFNWAEETLSRAMHGECRFKDQEFIATRIKQWVTRPEEVWLLETWLKEQNLSISSAAKKLNYSPTMLSAILQGTYFGRTTSGERVLPKLKEFLWLQKAREENPEVGFLKTSVAKKIFEICNMARRDRKKIYLVAARSGCGKTISFKRFQFENSGTMLIECFHNMGRRRLLQEIAQAAHLKPPQAFSPAFDKVVERLKASEELLIIDEASELNAGELKILRHLKDRTGIGMVISGTLALLKKLEDGAKEDLEQLHDRIKIKVRIEGIKKEDAEMYIKAAAPHLNGQLTETLIKKLYTLSEGKMRQLENILLEGIRIARLNNKCIEDVVEDAWSLCSMPQGN